MSEAYEFLYGNLDLPPLAVVIRGDDLSSGFYTTEYPYMVERRAKLTTYLSLWHRVTNQGGTLTDTQIQTMVESGRVEVQFHAGPDGHDPAMATNGSGGLGYFYAARKWRPTDGRVESDAEYVARIRADIQGFKSWYDSTIVPVNGGTTLHFAPPNGDMGGDGVGQTRPLLIQTLASERILTSTWKNHVQWMAPGFEQSSGGGSTGQANAFYDLPGLGTLGDTPETIRKYLRAARSPLSYMPEAPFASRFEWTVGNKSDWYASGVNGGDLFTTDGAPYLSGAPGSLKITFGATPGAGASEWNRTLPDDEDDAFLHVAVGIPAGFAMDPSKSMVLALVDGGGRVSVVSDASGVITAQAAMSTGGTPITLGTLTAPGTGVTWYALEVHGLRHSSRGMLEGWFNHRAISSQTGLNTGTIASRTVRVGRFGTGGQSGTNLLVGRLVVDRRFVGTRGL